MTCLRFPALLIVSLAFAGCGDDDDSSVVDAATLAVDAAAPPDAMPIDAINPDGPRAVDAGEAIDARPTIDAGEAIDARPTIDAGEAIDARPTPDARPSIDGGGAGAICGGFPGFMCSKSTYCDHIDNICGAADGTGTCTESPAACTEEYQPVCGCDGEVHSNECFAYSAGTDLNALGGCTPPAPDQFACGYRFCKSDSTYCRRMVPGVFGAPDDYECAVLPKACDDSPDCGCLTEDVCEDECVKLGPGALMVTCYGA